MIKQSIIILIVILVAATGCNKLENQSAQASKALDAQINQPGEIDIENIDHLVYLYKKATGQDKKTAKDFMRSAYDAMLMEPTAFPLLQYYEALMSYPTVASLLGTANGYLRTADRELEKADGNFGETNDSGNPAPRSYYELAIKYYSLTLDFSKSLSIPIDSNQNDDSIYSIQSTIKCIHKKIDKNNPKPDKSCGEVYDASLPPALLEMKSKQTIAPQ